MSRADEPSERSDPRDARQLSRGWFGQPDRSIGAARLVVEGT
jgi:hypothetical protein